jgi:anti-sigma regulatory factor (Ser/Thr protein kinase)
MNKAVKKAVKEQVDEYLKTIDIKNEVAFRVSIAISEIVTNFKTENEE